MHQLDTANSNTIKQIKKTIKRNNTWWDTASNAVNSEDSDEYTSFRYYEIPFNQNKESVFQILQRSTLSNLDDKDEYEE